MWTDILKFGPLLAGVSALIALALGFSRSAILRRQEQTFRDIRDSLPADTPHHTAITNLHRGTVGRLVARQLHGTWPFIWPWLVWLGIVGLFGQTGYYIARYLGTNTRHTFGDLVLEVFGPDWQSLILMPVVLLLISQVFVVYEHSLLQRARTARCYYNSGTIRHTRVAWRQNLTRKRRHSGLLKKATIHLPAFFATGLGLIVGTLTYAFTSDIDDQTRQDTLALATAIVFPTSLLLLPLSTLIDDVREHRANIDQLPKPAKPPLH